MQRDGSWAKGKGARRRISLLVKKNRRTRTSSDSRPPSTSHILTVSRAVADNKIKRVNDEASLIEIRYPISPRIGQAQPPLPHKNRDCRIFSKVGRAPESTCRHARTRAAASPNAPPPSASSPSLSFSSAHRSSRAIVALANGDPRPTCASSAVVNGHSPTRSTYATTPKAHTSCSLPKYRSPRSISGPA